MLGVEFLLTIRRGVQDVGGGEGPVGGGELAGEGCHVEVAGA